MTYTMENDDIMRWRGIKDEALKAIGRTVTGFALVAVDETGEVHWGADFSNDPLVWTEMVRRLKTMTHDGQDLLKRYPNGIK